MRIGHLTTSLIASALAPTIVHAWGIAGHEIVATIAQTQLHPLVRSHLCSILPSFTAYPSPAYPSDPAANHKHCHLAPLAAWPDSQRFRFPWSGHLHYINPLHDEPPNHCTFGEDGWTSDENVLTGENAIAGCCGSARRGELADLDTSTVSYSLSSPLIFSTLRSERDLALRFLVHYFGDLHMPLHLTGKARGGNDIWVKYEGRSAKLHSVWDGQMINTQLRSLANYTSPLPSARIESALRGKNYDSYVRWILAEGLGQTLGGDQGGWWADEAGDWTTCPEDSNRLFEASSGAQVVFGVPGRSLSGLAASPDGDTSGLPICPYAWAKPMHPLVCQYAFAPPVPSQGPKRADGQTYPPTPPGERPELDVPEYAGRIFAEKVIQRQLAMAGVRLAATLNSLLLDEATAAADLSS